ncbi:DnaJ domain [Musa troglodytarum]|uniref:DnaJ domain n=1 Tax=Musa troglodytarum TaxID=320322 RepID=A0A9E7GF75_9LILI|nr:DnaJ domain [Musa troglodytarum]
MEEIKAAYWRLSKEYHPDTTSLPLKAASEKFIQLREAYNVLSYEDNRRFYDWMLAQEVESRRLRQIRIKLDDPMKLSDQAMMALTIDIGIILFSIYCIIYVVLRTGYLPAVHCRGLGFRTKRGSRDRIPEQHRELSLPPNGVADGAQPMGKSFG